MVNTRKQQDEDYLTAVSSMSPQAVEKVQAVSDAIAKRYDAEAAKEAQLKWRILFQRTAPEMLPFVIYCLTFGPVAYLWIAHISNIERTKFYVLVGALILVMILPVVILPRLPFKDWFSKKEGSDKTQIPTSEPPPKQAINEKPAVI